jgi:tetratricopeptide (TPR) repeat protein
MVATTALRRALGLSPNDFFTLWTLRQIFDAQGMNEAALPMIERIAGLYPINKFQSNEQRNAGPIIEAYRRKLGSAPATKWQNLGELDQIVSSMMDTGRVESAAEVLERANPPERAPWDVVDRIATLRFRLGDAAGARSVWQKATVVPSPALRDARVAATYLAEADFARAEQSYAQAISQDAGLFEAHYGLAVLKRDAGDAAASLRHAELAVKTAPDGASRAAAEIIARSVRRFAKPHEDLN